MLEHIVLFRFKPETTDLTKQKIVEELLALKGKVPSILDISAGPNFPIETRDSNTVWSYVLPIAKALTVTRCIPLISRSCMN